MASLSLSTPPLKPSFFPSPNPKSLQLPKPQFLPYKSNSPLLVKSFASSPMSSISRQETKSPNLGLGLGFHANPFSATSSSSPPPQSPEGGSGADVMGLLLRERIVFLGSQIDDFVADAIISQLLLLDALDSTKDIRLFINSPGGSLSATMAIFDVVQLVRADVSTIGLGIAASTSSIILGGGTKGKRLAMPNTRIMVHQPLGGASGQAIDVEIQAKEIMHNKNNITRIVSGFTGRPFEQVQKDIDRDRYMSPIEAVEYGIIDGVIDRDSIIPLMPVPEKVKPRLNYEEINKDPRKFLTPEIPDDEIY